LNAPDAGEIDRTRVRDAIIRVAVRVRVAVDVRIGVGVTIRDGVVIVVAAAGQQGQRGSESSKKSVTARMGREASTSTGTC